MLPAVRILGLGVGFVGYLAVEGGTLKEYENHEAIRWRIAYWKASIPFQASPPESHHLLAWGIWAVDCAACHPIQFEDWSQSLHGESLRTPFFETSEFCRGCLSTRRTRSSSSERPSRTPTSNGSGVRLARK